ncbi:acetylglutamate kinase [Streptomyces kebangsaanensis]|uniref:acetylglutamate kinase n=1 Tax=Streptomyces kebangsaanensis TaxID=864058 RepID=UPI00093D5226|nr:acetylglutamate kinase [Streptomyces kebangsaanensis]
MTLVVKLGSDIDRDAVLDDIAALTAQGTRVVLVHGGGAEADRLSGQLGRTVEHLRSADGTSARRTDAAALDALTMALLGRVKPALLSGLRRRGIAATGLSGADGGTLTAVRKTALRVYDGGGRVRIVRDDLSGRVDRVDPALLRVLLAAGELPVLSPPAAAEDGTLLNVDADRAAAAVATALDATALVLLTRAPGVLRDPDRPDTVLPDLEVGPAAKLPPSVRGRMRHKLRSAADALTGGVDLVTIASGHGPTPVRAALHSHTGTRLRLTVTVHRRPA